MCDCSSKKRFVCHGNRGGGGCPCQCHHTGPSHKRNDYGISSQYRVIIGERLRAAREARGLSKKETAQLMGKDGATFLSHWEDGSHAPMKTLLRETCKGYGVSMTAILDGLPLAYIESSNRLQEV